MSKNKQDVNGMLRLVLDDDKLHCDGLKAGIWQSIKRVKHVVCNRWGANVHTLASSVSGIIYSISIETKEDSILDYIVSCLTSTFRQGNSRHTSIATASSTVIRRIRVMGGFSSTTVTRIVTMRRIMKALINTMMIHITMLTITNILPLLTLIMIAIWPVTIVPLAARIAMPVTVTITLQYH